MTVILTNDQKRLVYEADDEAIAEVLGQYGVPYDEDRHGEQMLLTFFRRALSDGTIPVTVLSGLPKRKVAAPLDLRSIGYSREQVQALMDMPRREGLVIEGRIGVLKLVAADDSAQRLEEMSRKTSLSPLPAPRTLH